MMGTPRKGEVVMKLGAIGGVAPPKRRGKESGVRAEGAVPVIKLLFGFRKFCAIGAFKNCGGVMTLML